MELNTIGLPSGPEVLFRKMKEKEKRNCISEKKRSSWGNIVERSI